MYHIRLYDHFYFLKRDKQANKQRVIEYDLLNESSKKLIENNTIDIKGTDAMMTFGNKLC